MAYLSCEKVGEGFVVVHNTKDPEVIDRRNHTRELVENAENQRDWARRDDVQPEVIQQQDGSEFCDSCHQSRHRDK